MTNVLVVDDDQDLCDSLSYLINDLSGMIAITANSFFEVQELGDDLSRFHFAFLDVNLGLGLPTGIDVYQWLVSHRFQGKIIFFTGHALNHPLLVTAASFPNVQILEKPARGATIRAILQGGKP